MNGTIPILWTPCIENKPTASVNTNVGLDAPCRCSIGKENWRQQRYDNASQAQGVVVFFKLSFSFYSGPPPADQPNVTHEKSRTTRRRRDSLMAFVWLTISMVTVWLLFDSSESSESLRPCNQVFTSETITPPGRESCSVFSIGMWKKIQWDINGD